MEQSSLWFTKNHQESSRSWIHDTTISILVSPISFFISFFTFLKISVSSLIFIESRNSMPCLTKMLVYRSIHRLGYDYRRVRAQLLQNQPSITTIHTISISTCYQSARYSKFAMPFTLGWTLLSLCALVQEDTATLAAPHSTATISTLPSWSPTHEPRLVALPHYPLY